MRLNRIASANIKDFKRQDGAWLDIDELPDRLAEAIRGIEFNKDGTVKNIELHDKERALTILLKHLGGEVINNTQVNVISDEQRIAVVMSLPARAHETTIDCAREPAEQSPAPEQSPALLRRPLWPTRIPLSSPGGSALHLPHRIKASRRGVFRPPPIRPGSLLRDEYRARRTGGGRYSSASTLLQVLQLR